MPYDPGLGLQESPWVGGNREYIFSVFSDRIETRQLNFYFLQVSNQQQGQPSINLMCQARLQDTHYYLIEVVSSLMGQTYSNQPVLPEQDKTLYSQKQILRLREAFKGEAFCGYNLSSNCSFIPPLQSEVVSEVICFSIYNRENCICLLYTSPSPRDLSTSRMPSSA